MTTASRFPLALRSATLLTLRTFKVFVRSYVPAAIKIVVFEVRLSTAFCSWAAVETLTTLPEGGGSGEQELRERDEAANPGEARPSASQRLKRAERRGRARGLLGTSDTHGTKRLSSRVTFGSTANTRPSAARRRCWKGLSTRPRR